MQYDLIIVGGGVVGAGFAVALKETPLKIALIDARLPSNNDGRLFALNDGSCHFLKNIDIWSALEEHASPIQQIHVSCQGRFGAVRLHHKEAGLAALGNVVPAKHIEFALNEALATQKNLTVYRPAKLETLEQKNGLAHLAITMNDEVVKLVSPVVMGADGAESTVRVQSGIEVETVDYSQTAIVTRTTLRRAHKQIAYERFVKDGAIAMLPLNDKECATIWSLDNEKANELLASSDQDFLQALQQQFGYRLGRLDSISKRFHYPLKLVKAKTNYSGNVFLLGNAAHTVHPIAAQGFNLALYEVATLVEALHHRLVEVDTIVMQDLLLASDQIKKQQQVSMNVSHKLADMFLTRSKIKQSALQLGMLGLDLAVPVKQRFMSAVLGRTGNVPDLLMDKSG